MGEPRGIAAGPREAVGKTCGDWIRLHREHDWDWGCLLPQRRDGGRTARHDDVLCELQQLRHDAQVAIRINCAEAGNDLDIAAFHPSERRKSLLKRREAGPCFLVVVESDDKSDPPHARRLLRARRERPRRSAGNERDELAPPHHSITSSARASSVGSTSRPSAILRPLARTVALFLALALGVVACLLVLVVMVRRSYSKLLPPLAGAVV